MCFTEELAEGDTDEMVGSVVSIISALFAPREFSAPGGTSVK